MFFDSTVFIFLFLPFLLLVYFLSPTKIKNFTLLIASLFFYLWGEVQYIYIILLSILINYIASVKIDKCHKEKNAKNAKKILVIGIVANLLLLSYFKYANFLIKNLNVVLALLKLSPVRNKQIHLPLGISFFTFKAISYIVDVYKRKTKVQKNFWNLALYISLFPQLIAGPIMRYDAIEKDLNKRKHNLNDITEGLRRFIRGFGKKVLIANTTGEIADVVFQLKNTELNITATWIGIIAYTMQIFFDFSGYTDMAIGLGKVFGFTFPENFNFPYISKSIQEFWRRWHITLSTWLKDYLYIPLGGNRHGTLKTYRNLITVFLLCGLWHGAAWNFIIWGLYHGTFLILERVKFGEALKKSPKFIQHAYAMLTVSIGWILFRSNSFGQINAYIINMLNVNKGFKIPVDLYLLMNNFTYIILGSAFLLSTPFANWSFSGLRNKLGEKSVTLKFIRDFWLILVFVFSLMKISAGTHNPFIYFRF